jgi:membrane-associated protease RseP (regulator of RpoE activity)
MITALTVLGAVGILGLGFYRAKPYGKLGILAWLQSVILMAPWLVFFGLFAANIYLNLVGVLLLLLISTGLYIWIGRQLRAAAQAELTKAVTAVSPPTAADSSPEASPVNPPVKSVEPVPEFFGIDTFFVTETVPYQNGAIFRGNLRGAAAAAFTRLSASLQERLGDRYRLFLVENQEDRPVVVVLPSANDPQPMSLAQKLLAGVLLVVTIGTSLETAGLLLSFDLASAPQRVMETAPIASSILAVLTVHELGHWLMARRHQVRLSFPFFIPTWQIGSFGAITRFTSLVPNRTALFDIAFAGPAAGGLLSLGLLLTGLLLSHPGSEFKVPTQFFEGSILVGTLARVVMGTAVQQSMVDVHPLVILGWLGLLITAINLMPAGQLDGGRLVQAIYGRKTLGRTTIATFLVLAIASLVNPLALYWAVVILVLQRNQERPNLNELTEPDDARAALALLALFLMVVTLLPLTPSLAGRLGFGG